MKAQEKEVAMGPQLLKKQEKCGGVGTAGSRTMHVLNKDHELGAKQHREVQNESLANNTHHTPTPSHCS